jgi:hypothetical protein
MVTEQALDLVTGDAVPQSKEGGQSMQEEMHTQRSKGTKEEAQGPANHSVLPSSLISLINLFVFMMGVKSG